MSGQVGMQIEEPTASKAADLSSFAELFQIDLAPVSCESIGELWRERFQRARKWSIRG